MLSAYCDLAAYIRPQWLDGEDTGMSLEVYFGDSICQTRNGFVTMDKKGVQFRPRRLS